jgi:hypothetical protein
VPRSRASAHRRRGGPGHGCVTVSRPAPDSESIQRWDRRLQESPQPHAGHRISPDDNMTKEQRSSTSLVQGRVPKSESARELSVTVSLSTPRLSDHDHCDQDMPCEAAPAGRAARVGRDASTTGQKTITQWRDPGSNSELGGGARTTAPAR